MRVKMSSEWRSEIFVVLTQSMHPRVPQLRGTLPEPHSAHAHVTRDQPANCIGHKITKLTREHHEEPIRLQHSASLCVLQSRLILGNLREGEVEDERQCRVVMSGGYCTSSSD